MLLRLAYRFSLRRPVLQAALAYKNSATQSKMHEYDQDEAAIRKVKSTIDYETIDK